MSRNNDLILVVCFMKRYYVVPRVNTDTQLCNSFAWYVVSHPGSRWTYRRDSALVRAHVMQRRFGTEHGVREFQLRSET